MPVGTSDPNGPRTLATSNRVPVEPIAASPGWYRDRIDAGLHTEWCRGSADDGCSTDDVPVHACSDRMEPAGPTSDPTFIARSGSLNRSR